MRGTTSNHHQSPPIWAPREDQGRLDGTGARVGNGGAEHARGDSQFKNGGRVGRLSGTDHRRVSELMEMGWRARVVDSKQAGQVRERWENPVGPIQIT